MKLIEFITIFLIVIKFTKSWDLTSLNITNFQVIQVSRYYTRAFLCIKSTTSEIIPTFIETNWPENVISFQPKIFPNSTIILRNDETIQEAVTSDVDRKGRLWLIDNLNPPKLIIYNLLQFNTKIVDYEFSDEFERNSISSIVCDTIQDGSSNSFISFYEKEFLLIYSFKDRSIKKLNFIDDKRDFNQKLHFPIITFGFSCVLFLTDNSGRLFYLDVLSLRRKLDFSWAADSESDVSVRYLGELLRPTESLIVDPKGCLYYIIKKYGCVLRWNPK